MNLRKRETHRVSSHYWGWTARPFPLRLTAVGKVFVLTSPFIEQQHESAEKGNSQSLVTLLGLDGKTISPASYRRGEGFCLDIPFYRTVLSATGNECRLWNRDMDGTQLPMEGYLGFEFSRQVRRYSTS